MGQFLDARSDDVATEISANICIIGAGAAGLSLARKLAKTVPGVLLIEAGGFEPEGQTQLLFAGNQLGLPYFNLTTCRLRYFGGTTNHWSGYCRANDLIDYEGRPELGLPKWPVSHDELEPYVSEVGELFSISGAHFDARQVLLDKGLDANSLPDGQSPDLVSKVFQFAQNMRLGKVLKSEIELNQNLTQILNLNLCHIQLSEDARTVSNIVCATTTGKKVTVKANKFALCCHGIENARILLTSNDVMTAGIGNQSDNVGRYFMDHIHIKASTMVPTGAFPAILDRTYSGAHNLNLNVGFSDSFLRDNQLLQYYCRFEAYLFDDDTRDIAAGVRNRIMEPGNLQFLMDLGHLGSQAAGLGSSYVRQQGWGAPLPSYYILDHRLEQAPNRDSRVVVSDRRDAIGNLIADLDWRINEHDVRSFSIAQKKIATEVAALGIGRVQEEEITRELVEDRIEGHYHQIGTTRMSFSPSDGVVDSNCKVHGVENLYIGGSSVFPTAGYSGPTMMLMAMAYRLADHLSETA